MKRTGAYKWSYRGRDVKAPNELLPAGCPQRTFRSWLTWKDINVKQRFSRWKIESFDIPLNCASCLTRKWPICRVHLPTWGCRGGVEIHRYYFMGTETWKEEEFKKKKGSISLCIWIISHVAFLIDIHAEVNVRTAPSDLSRRAKQKAWLPCSYKHCQEQTTISRNLWHLPWKNKKGDICKFVQVTERGWCFRGKESQEAVMLQRLVQNNWHARIR